MGGYTPTTEIGGQAGAEHRTALALSMLGHISGLIIFWFALSLLVAELVFNPVFLFAQAEQNKVDIGSPLTSLGWWTMVVVTFATTGIQYALFDPRKKTGSLGHIVGWVVACVDTVMDVAGISCWMENAQNGDYLSADSSRLTLGILPRMDSPWYVWVVCLGLGVVCLLHEVLLAFFLQRVTFEATPDAGELAINAERWIYWTGVVFSNFRSFSISAAPYVLLALDLLLSTQGAREANPVITGAFFVITLAITAVTMMAWQYYAHLNETLGGQGRITKLDRKHQLVFAGAATITLVDTIMDVAGFNALVYGNPTILPPHVDQALSGLLLTALVVSLTMFFEPLFRQVFSPLSAVVDRYVIGNDDSGRR